MAIALSGDPTPVHETTYTSTAEHPHVGDFLVVFVCGEMNGAITMTATFNGAPMQSMGGGGSDPNYVGYVFGLPVATGTHDVVVTDTQSHAASLDYIIQSFTGVHQTTYYNAKTGAQITSGTFAPSPVSSASGNMVIDTFACYSGSEPTAAGDNVKVANKVYNCCASYAAGAASVQMSWSFTYAVTGWWQPVELLPAGGGGGGGGLMWLA